MQLDILDQPKRGGIGVLTEQDHKDLDAGTKRVYELMEDGGWYERDEIELAAGQNGRPAREGMRRMRELRQRGFNIEKIRLKGSREWKYRLVK